MLPVFFGFILHLDWVVGACLLLGFVLWTRHRHVSKKFFSVATFIFVTIGCTSISQWPGVYLENYYPKSPHLPDDIGGFVLLGGYFNLYESKMRNEPVYNKAASRLFSFMTLVKKHPHKKIIFTGTKLEADLTKLVFKEHGLDENRIVIDDMARNTEDNARNSIALMGGERHKPWVIVTSAFHLPRSVNLYQSQGIKAIPYPVDYHTSGQYDITIKKDGFYLWFVTVKEWAGLVNYYINKTTPHLLPVK